MGLFHNIYIATQGFVTKLISPLIFIKWWFLWLSFIFIALARDFWWYHNWRPGVTTVSPLAIDMKTAPTGYCNSFKATALRDLRQLFSHVRTDALGEWLILSAMISVYEQQIRGAKGFY